MVKCFIVNKLWKLILLLKISACFLFSYYSSCFFFPLSFSLLFSLILSHRLFFFFLFLCHVKINMFMLTILWIKDFILMFLFVEVWYAHVLIKKADFHAYLPGDLVLTAQTCDYYLTSRAQTKTLPNSFLHCFVRIIKSLVDSISHNLFRRGISI